MTKRIQTTMLALPFSTWAIAFYAVLFNCFGTGYATAATYYVATTGVDTATGSAAQPWRTLQRAANVVNPGDTVLVATGVYRESVRFTRSGTSSQRVVFRNATGQYPVIDGQGLSIGQWGALVGFTDVGYVRLEGFEIRNSPAFSVYVGGESHHLELMNLNVHNGASSGIWLEGPKVTPAMSVISGSRVHDNQLGGITVWLATGGYYRIEGNEVWGNQGVGNYDGIQVGGGDGGTHHIVVKNNIVHHNGSSNNGADPLDTGGHGINHHYLVEGNYIHDSLGSLKTHSGGLAYYTPGVSGYHIVRFNVSVGSGYVTYGYPNPVAIYNNTFINCGQAFFIWNDSSPDGNLGDSTYTGGDTGRMSVKNNVFWQEVVSSSNYLMLTAGSYPVDVTYRSVRLQNNLYKVYPGQNFGWNGVQGPMSPSVFLAYQQSNAPNYPDTGSVLTSAAFSQMFAAADDYHLLGTSPAIDKGTALTKALNAGSNATTLVVDRASYFHDGFCLNGECLSTPDSIVIGNSAPIRIVAVDGVKNTITLASPANWTIGTPVTLPFIGNAPDMGALEYSATSLPAPTNLRIIR